MNAGSVGGVRSRCRFVRPPLDGTAQRGHPPADHGQQTQTALDNPGEHQIPLMAMLNVRDLVAQDGGQLVVGEGPDQTAGHDHLAGATGGAEGDELLTG